MGDPLLIQLRAEFQAGEIERKRLAKIEAERVLIEAKIRLDEIYDNIKAQLVKDARDGVFRPTISVDTEDDAVTQELRHLVAERLRGDGLPTREISMAKHNDKGDWVGTQTRLIVTKNLGARPRRGNALLTTNGELK